MGIDLYANKNIPKFTSGFPDKIRKPMTKSWQGRGLSIEFEEGNVTGITLVNRTEEDPIQFHHWMPVNDVNELKSMSNKVVATQRLNTLINIPHLSTFLSSIAFTNIHNPILGIPVTARTHQYLHRTQDLIEQFRKENNISSDITIEDLKGNREFRNFRAKFLSKNMPFTITSLNEHFLTLQTIVLYNQIINEPYIFNDIDIYRDIKSSYENIKNDMPVLLNWGVRLLNNNTDMNNRISLNRQILIDNRQNNDKMSRES